MPSSVLDDLGLADPHDNGLQTAGGSPAVWTLLGEAGTDPAGQLRVASTLHNRAQESQSDYDQVAADPKQGYEAWQNSDDRRKYQQQYPVGSKEYQAAQDLLTNLKTGKIQPTDDYSFYSPKAQEARGRPAPSFDNGSGVDVGGNRFFTKPGGSALDSLGLTEPATTGGPADAPNAGPDVGITNAVTSGRIGNTAQQLTLRKLQAIGDLTDDPKGGSLYKGAPIYTPASADETKGVPDGSYYLDPTGQIQYAGAKQGDLVTGAKEGLGDVALSGVKMIPGSADSDIRQKLQQYQNQYNASNRGNPISDLGRFSGQMAASIPLLAGGGALAQGVARAVPAVAPAVSFLGGGAGTGATKIASIAANSGIQGAGQAGLTSSTSDKPVLQQMAEGFGEGGLLGPLAHGAGNLLTKYALRKTPAPDIANVVDDAVNKFGINLKTKPTQDAAQHSQWIKSIGDTFGADTSKITHNIQPTVLKTAIDNIGDTMNTLKGKYNLPVGNDLKIGLNDAYNAAKSQLTPDQLKPIDSIIAGIKSKVVNGEISGPAYQALTGRNSALDKAVRASGLTGYHAGVIKDALDDAFQTVMGPQDAATWTKARTQYKNAMTVADAIGPNGTITPNDLSTSVANKFRNKSIYGAGDLGKLDDVGQLFMQPSKGSNFLNRHVGSISVGTGTALAGTAQAFLHNPALAVGPAVVGAGIAGANRFLRNRAYNVGQAVNPLLAGTAKAVTTPTAVNAFQSNQGR